MIDVKKLPVQARLTHEELGLLDQVVEAAQQRVRGLEMSRAEALRLAAIRGAQVLLEEWRAPQTVSSPSAGPALMGLEEVATISPDMTPLQQVALAVPSPQTVEAAATVAVPELENSVDLSTMGATSADSTPALVDDALERKREGERRKTVTSRVRKKASRTAAELS